MAELNQPPLIIADSSPLIAFALLNLIPELASLAHKVLIPTTVVHECTQNLSLPGARNIQQAISDHLLAETPDMNLNRSPELKSISELVDPGEAQAIAVAQVQKGLLLIDDKAGRRCAKHLNIPITGSLGVLLKLKQTGQIKILKPLLDELNQHGYRYSPALVQAVLKKAAES